MERYEKILNEIGMPAAIVGYNYWKYALKIYDEHREEYQRNLDMGELYIQIAEKFDVNPNNVERCLRYSRQAIKNIHKKLDVDYPINNRNFFVLLAQKIRSEE